MNVTVRCPRTDRPLQLSLPVDGGSIASRWHKVLRFSCPHCAFRHRIAFRRAWTAAAADLLAASASSRRKLPRSSAAELPE